MSINHPYTPNETDELSSILNQIDTIHDAYPLNTPILKGDPNTREYQQKFTKLLEDIDDNNKLMEAETNINDLEEKLARIRGRLTPKQLLEVYGSPNH